MNPRTLCQVAMALSLTVGCAASSPGRAPASPVSPPIVAAQPSGAALHAAVASLIDRDRTLLVADEDNGSLVVLDTASRSIRARVTGLGRPVAALCLDDGRVLVVDRRGDCVRVLTGDLRGDALRERAVVAVAPDPVGLSVSPDRRTIYVTSGASGKLTELDADSLRARRVLPLAREPRAMAFSPDGRTLYVSHLVGASLSAVDLARHLVRLLPLPHAAQRAAFEAQRLRRPNATGARVERNATALARALTVSRDGTTLYVAHVVEATQETQAETRVSEGYGASARVAPPVVPTVSALDLRTESWRSADASARSDTAAPAFFADPSAVAVRPSDGKLLVTGLGTRSLSVLESSFPDPALAGRTMLLSHCDGPTGLAAAADGTAWVFCQFDHEVQAISTVTTTPVAHVVVGADPLAPDLALGRRLFHRADLPEISHAGFSCGTCHPDGRDDGNVWSSPDGARQTPFLAGRLEDTAPYNWLGATPSLDENMRQTMRRLRGDGLSANALGALGAYLRSGLQPPRSALGGDAPPDAVAHGQRLFAEAGCASCHSPDRGFIDGHTHDVGIHNATDHTLAFDTPSLRFVGMTAPYGHDGRYPSLGAMLAATDHRMTPTIALTQNDLGALTDYLRTL